MENKCIKKSTLFQLQALVDYMEENPQFARGTPVFGGSKMSTEEQWQKLVLKLNSMGPPVRSIVEWKKTWADLKSRTKKKIAENKNSLLQTGGGLYRQQSLSALEEAIDRTLFLSKSAAPVGFSFGLEETPTETTRSIDSCFQSLISSPPRGEKAVAVVTPTRQHDVQHPHAADVSSHPQQQHRQQPHTAQQPQNDVCEQQQRSQLKRQRQHVNVDDEMPGCSLAKKRREDQLSLIRRQIRVSEEALCIAKEQANNIQILADATKRMADAAVAQAEAAKISADAAVAQNAILENIAVSIKELIKNK